MGLRDAEVVPTLAPCSSSTPMARGLRICTASQAATELLPTTDCFYRAIHFMARRLEAAFRAEARCSASTPMARGLQPSIVLRQLITLFPVHTQTAMEHIRRN